jgi:hypothetical protein
MSDVPISVPVMRATIDKKLLSRRRFLLNAARVNHAAFLVPPRRRVKAGLSTGSNPICGFQHDLDLQASGLAVLGSDSALAGFHACPHNCQAEKGSN